MTSFTARPLGVLDRIYRFVGGLRGNSDLDLLSPIQLVHDVARQSELGSGDLWVLSATQVHVGAGSITSTVDPWAPVAPVNGYLAADDEDIWVYRCDGVLRAGAGVNIGGAIVQVIHTSQIRGNDVSTVPRTLVWVGSSGSTQNGNTTTQTVSPDGPPVRMRKGDVLWLTSTETGGVGITYEMNVMVWKGPRGTTPPGTS